MSCGGSAPCCPASALCPGCHDLSLVTQQGSATLSSAWCCLPSQREQTRALISRSFALLEHEHGKLQSCLEERAAAQKREEEALQAKEEVQGCLLSVL